MREPFHRRDAVTIWHGDALNLDMIPDRSVDLVVTSPPYFGLRSYTDDGEPLEGQVGSEATPADFLDALIAATREMVRTLKPSGSIFVNMGDKYAATSFDPQRRGKDARAVERPTVSRICERSGCGVRFTGGPGRRFCSSRCGGSDNTPRVLRPGLPPNGSLLGIPQRYMIRCMDELGLIIRAEIIWEKTNAAPESPRSKRVRRNHEHLFHLVPAPRATWKGLGYYADMTQVPVSARGGYAVPGSVWSIPTTPLRVPRHLAVSHTAAFPPELPRRIIGAWCPEGGAVLDPFGGTGTTGMVAKALGRRADLVDLSRDYCRLAQWRVNDPGELARVLEAEMSKASA